MKQFFSKIFILTEREGEICKFVDDLYIPNKSNTIVLVQWTYIYSKVERTLRFIIILSFDSFPSYITKVEYVMKVKELFLC